MNRHVLATGLLAVSLVGGYSLYVYSDPQRPRPAPPAGSTRPTKPAPPSGSDRPTRPAPPAGTAQPAPAPPGRPARPDAPVVGRAAPRTTPSRPRTGEGGPVPFPYVYPYPGIDLAYWYGYPYQYPGPYTFPYPWYIVTESSAGHLRLDVAEKDASVYVDGYYAGIVDDFNGLFHQLKLTVGPHTIEIRKAGFETLCVDVNIQGNQTVTYRGTMKRVEEEISVIGSQP